MLFTHKIIFTFIIFTSIAFGDSTQRTYSNESNEEYFFELLEKSNDTLKSFNYCDYRFSDKKSGLERAKEIYDKGFARSPEFDKLCKIDSNKVWNDSLIGHSKEFCERYKIKTEEINQSLELANNEVLKTESERSIGLLLNSIDSIRFIANGDDFTKTPYEVKKTKGKDKKLLKKLIRELKKLKSIHVRTLTVINHFTPTRETLKYVRRNKLSMSNYKNIYSYFPTLAGANFTENSTPMVTGRTFESFRCRQNREPYGSYEGRMRFPIRFTIKESDIPKYIDTTDKKYSGRSVQLNIKRINVLQSDERTIVITVVPK